MMALLALVHNELILSVTSPFKLSVDWANSDPSQDDFFGQKQQNG